MTVAEAARRMGVSLSLTYKLIEEKRLPHRRIGQRGRRGKIVLTDEDVEAFLKSCAVRA